MPDKASPMIQVETLTPFIRAAEAADLDLPELLVNTGLTTEMISDPDAAVPASSVYRFTELVAKTIGDTHLGIRLGLSPNVSEWPPVADALAKSDKLADFLARFVIGSTKFSSAVRFKMEIGAEVSWFIRDRGYAPREIPAQVDGFGAGLFIGIFKVAMAENWRASEMLLKICDPEAVRIKEIGACALVKGDTRTFACSFPSKWLIQPIRLHTRTGAPTKIAQQPTEALISAIRSNIRSQLANPDFGVPELVAQMGLNRRSVQRHLRERGSGLRELIEEEREGAARRLVEENTASLETIADELGYNNASNFTRAFKRWTGQSPSSWRKTER